MTRNSTRDTVVLSNRDYSEFPQIPKPGTIVGIDASHNLIAKLPSFAPFGCLRYLDLSYNRLTDLSPLSDAQSLRELCVSHNRLESFDFIQSLSQLEIFNGSYNNVGDVTVAFPDSLIDVDLSHNVLSSLEFLQNFIPKGIETLDVSGNAIDELFSLRFVSVFGQLKSLRVGLLADNENLPVIQFVKHLCPSLEFFDGIECIDDEEDTFDIDILYQILVNGSENELRDFLQNPSPQIRWDDPVFIDFDDSYPDTPLKTLLTRLDALESQIEEREPVAKIDPLVDIKNDIRDIKSQITQITKLLYAHDRALANIWKTVYDRQK